MTLRSLPSMGIVSALCLVVANMIGAGVFTTSGFALADLGDSTIVLVAWAVGGVVACCGAVSYAALAVRFRASGGEYLYLARSVHPLAGFVAGWVSFLAGFTGAIAFAAVGFEHYVLPQAQRPEWLPPGAVAILAILASAALHGYRVAPAARTQNVLVGLKLLLLLTFIGFALVQLARGGWQGLPGTSVARGDRGFSATAFAVSLMWISLSYSGFNAAVYVAGEIRQPQRTIPRALCGGTLLVAVLYLALNAVFLWAPPYDAVVGRADVAAVAARNLGGSTLDLAVRALIALALLTSVSSMVMAGPRVYAQMAEDGLFPRWLRFGQHAPRAAIALQAAAAVLVTLAADLRVLLSYLGFTLSVTAALTVSTIFILRFKDKADRVAVPGYPWPPLVFVLATLCFAALAAMRNPWECAAGGATLVSGVAAYALLRQPARPGSRS